MSNGSTRTMLGCRLAGKGPIPGRREAQIGGGGGDEARTGEFRSAGANEKTWSCAEAGKQFQVERRGGPAVSARSRLGAPAAVPFVNFCLNFRIIIQNRQENTLEKQTSYQCRCSFLVVHNEKIKDLLEPSRRDLQGKAMVSHVPRGTFSEGSWIGEMQQASDKSVIISVTLDPRALELSELLGSTISPAQLHETKGAIGCS